MGMTDISSSDDSEKIEIPDSVLVECPKANKALVRGSMCIRCQHHMGIKERFANPKLTFSQRYMMVCNFPVGRMLFEMAGEQ